ncbi:hypothetical protein [Streptomyces albus]|uniref:hypothetical protein n=1 Tax=Streptomyces sp. NRRL F-5639 TaxID=1463867 RepID=UPI00131A7039|nr:hypothetical protein [Streptomyces sp. NRRL F-5639]
MDERHHHAFLGPVANQFVATPSEALQRGGEAMGDRETGAMQGFQGQLGQLAGEEERGLRGTVLDRGDRGLVELVDRVLHRVGVVGAGQAQSVRPVVIVGVDGAARAR